MADRRLETDDDVEHHDFEGTSSRVAEAWYSHDNEVVEVLFPDDVHWLYLRVKPVTWTRFLKADSPGRYLREVLEQHPHRAGTM